jgi:ferritin-like metal-binding protein YciE
MNIDSLDTLLEDELKDLYSAEKQLLKALPKMAKAADNAALQKAFSGHLKETKGQVARLDKAGKLLGIKLAGKKCKAMEGLIEEGKEVLEAKGPAELIDAALIGAAQRVEHYEMAGYGTARAFAEQLGRADIAKLLQQTLDEEAAADEKLTAISQDAVLPMAKTADDSSDSKNGRSKRR